MKWLPTICVMLMLAGCVTARLEMPDGTTLDYARLGNQKIDGIVYENGGFLIEGQKSEHEKLYEAITKLVDKIP